MGTINEKISYLAETKTRQKNLINALGGNITNDTPFREYENELIGVLPKVTGEGTNISLSPTIEYDLEVGYKGDTTQDTLNGYQLWSFTDGRYSNNGLVAIVENGIITINGTASPTSFLTIPITNSMTWENGTYSISVYNNQVQNDIRFRVNTTGAQDMYLTSINKTGTVTYSGETTFMQGCLIRVPDGITLTNFTLKPMLEKGSTAHSYEEYCGGIPSPNPNYPQDIQVVTGTQEVEVVGKNLFDNNTERKNAYIGASSSDVGQTITYYNSGATYSYVNGAFVEAEKTYTLSWKQNSTPVSTNTRIGAIVDSNNIILALQDTWINSRTSITFTPSVSGYLVLCTDINSTNIMLELGSTATTYEPYQSQSYTLHLGDEELCKIGSYQDKIYYEGGKWYLEKQLEKINLFNHSQIILQSINSYGIANFLIMNLEEDVSGDVTPKRSSLCNRFSQQATIISQTTTEGFLPSLNTNNKIFNLYIRIDSSRASTVEQFKQWLQNNETLYYFPPQTPSTTEITNDGLLQDLNYIKEHIKSFSDTTNISTSGNLPIVITASAIKQLS